MVKLIQLLMHPSFQQTQFAPWHHPVEKPNPFQLQSNHTINDLTFENKPNNQKQQQNLNKKIIKKQKSNNYSKVQPKVYDRGQELGLSNKNQKTDKNRLEIILKSVNKNDLVIRIPQDPFRLPKVQIEHPIKHSMKSLKRDYQTADVNSGSRSVKVAQRNDNLSEFKQRVRKGSTDMIHNPSYASVSKKISTYEDQIVKKCSLKNLKIYNQQDLEQDVEKIKQILNKKKSNQKVSIPKEKTHILDRILSRLQ